MAEPTMIYKITILELLGKSGFPLSNSQISDFFLDYNLTDYFTAQQAISDDEEAGFIVSSSTHNSTTYGITEDGKKTLELFRNKLSQELVADIGRYLRANSMAMKEENSYKATFFKADRGGYVVQLKILEDDHSTMDLTFHVSTQAMAETLCNNWKARCEDVYASIMDILM